MIPENTDKAMATRFTDDMLPTVSPVVAARVLINRQSRQGWTFSLGHTKTAIRIEIDGVKHFTDGTVCSCKNDVLSGYFCEAASFVIACLQSCTMADLREAIAVGDVGARAQEFLETGRVPSEGAV